MSHLVAESIWHFAGYLHIAELLNLSPVHYDGAPLFQITGYSPESTHTQGGLEVDLPDSARGLRISVPAQVPGAISETMPAVERMPPIEFKPPIPVYTISIDESQLFGTPPAVAGAPAVGQALPDITITYTLGGRQDLRVDVSQHNTLLDDDLVLDDDTLEGDPNLSVSVRSSLEHLIEIAEGEVPAELLPPPLPEGAASDTLWLGDALEVGPGASGSPSVPLSVAANGTHVNGVLISELGQSLEQQNADVAEIADRILSKGDFGEPRPVEHSLTADGFDGGLPSNEVTQIWASGGNVSANVAALYDLGDAFGSRIILGNYYETNAIFQVNVFSSDGPGKISGGVGSAIDQAAIVDNVLRNEASFLNAPGQIYGDVVLGGFGGVENWQVDYVQGHFVDVSSVVQRNFVTDNDIGAITEMQSHYIVTAGENGQLNLTNLLEIGKEYDLIIIGGDYHKYNGIYQFNVVMDGNGVEQLYGSSGSVTAIVGDNLLANDAAIIGTGGASHRPLTDNVASLAESIANQEPVIGGGLAAGLPGGADGVIDVLYISGDYYNYNIVLQTNVIADVDAISQGGAAAIDDGAATGQLADTGGNAALNGAVIYDLDSQSDYQFLGGEAYEETLLVQSNIIAETEDLGAGASDDVLAMVAALSGGDDEGPDASAGVAMVVGDADVMGSVLS